MIRTQYLPRRVMYQRVPLAQLYVVPGALIALCSDSACATPVASYTDSGGLTNCPINAPVTAPGTAVCSMYAGPQGQFGFWLAAGTYYYTTTISGVRYGPYPISTGTSTSISFNPPSWTTTAFSQGFSVNVGSWPNTLRPVQSVVEGVQGACQADSCVHPLAQLSSLAW